MTDKDAKDPQMVLCQRAAEGLMEHFDAVQIFCSRYEPTDNTTRHISFGRGDIFARATHALAWATARQGELKESMRLDADDEDDDEDDDNDVEKEQG